MGRKHRSASNEGGVEAESAGVAPGKRALTQAISAKGAGGAAPAPAPMSPVTPPPKDDPFGLHLRPEPVRLSEWFDEVFGKVEEGISFRPDANTSYKLESTALTRTLKDGDTKQKDKIGLDLEKGSLSFGQSDETNSAVGKDGDRALSSSSWKGDLGKGKASWSDSSGVITPRADGTREKREQGTDRSVAIGDGAMTFGWGSWDQAQSLDKDDEKVSSQRDERKAKVGLLANEEDGVGVKLGGSLKRSQKEGSWTSEKEGEANVGITDKGVMADATGKGKWANENGFEAQVKASADGAFTVEVIPPKPGTTGHYKLITTLRAGGSLGGSVGHNGKPEDEGDANTVGVSASGKLGASLVYVHVMEEAEVRRYLAELDQADAGKAPGTHPEFGMLDTLRAAATGKGETMVGAAAMLGSAEAASQLPAGDSIDLTLSAGGALGVKGGLDDRGWGAGIDVGGGRDYTRTARIAGGKGGTVAVTVTFVQTDKLRKGGSVTAEGVTMAGHAAAAESSGDSRTYTLDPALPDYHACYDKVLGVWSREGLAALDEDQALAEHLTSATRSSSGSDDRGGQVGLLGLAVKGGQKQSGSAAITKDKDGYTGEFTGAQTDKFALGAGADLAQKNVTNRTTASVDEHGAVSAELETEEASTDLWKTLGNATKTVKGWFGYTDEKEGTNREVLMGALAKTPGERLTELLEQTYTRLSGYHLSAGDVDVIVARAADEANWLHCATNGAVYAPMRALREALLDPAADPTLEIDLTDPTQVARAHALARARDLADFMKRQGAAGMDAMINVIRHWGARMQKESTADDLGRRFEWPPALAAEHALYQRVVKEVEGVEATFAKLAGRPDARAAATGVLEHIRHGLTRARVAVLHCSDLHSERARFEMLDEMSRYETVTETAHHELVAQLPDAATAATMTEPAGELVATEPGERSMAQRLAPERILTLHVDLQRVKRTEAAMFARTAAEITGGDRDAALRELSELRDLYEFWHARTVELRGAYQVAGVPAAQQQPGLEPDVKRMISLWKQSGGDRYQQVDWASRWEARWGT